VRAQVVVWQNADAVKVPLSSLFRKGEGWAVFVLAGERAGGRDITLGRRSNAEAEVTSGLREGEALLLHPSDKVAEGVRVSAR
jgi:HlyD family secretion protein